VIERKLQRKSIDNRIYLDIFDLFIWLELPPRGKKVQELDGKDARIAAMHEVVRLQEKTIDEMVRAQEKISEAQRRR
jgi:hypothetical protein